MADNNGETMVPTTLAATLMASLAATLLAGNPKRYAIEPKTSAENVVHNRRLELGYAVPLNWKLAVDDAEALLLEAEKRANQRATE